MNGSTDRLQGLAAKFRRISPVSFTGLVVVLLLIWIAARSESQTRQSPIRADEVVELFPASARLDRERAEWVLPIHGWIYEPETADLARNALLTTFRTALGLSADQESSKIFLERARPFLTDNERAKRIAVAAAGAKSVTNPSAANGHFTGEIRLSMGAVQQLLENTDSAARFVSTRVVLPTGDNRTFQAYVQVVEPSGTSIVSDIDDTIKVSQVPDKKALLENSFLNEFQSVPGMGELYRQWSGRGCVFHYVSASPWQMYRPIAEFLARCNFPRGSFHMKSFRWKDESFWSLFEKQEQFKRPIIEGLLRDYPDRVFVLVGDSGEQDPEIYAAIARDYPTRIKWILIRDMTGKDADAPRYKAAFHGIPTDRWKIFGDSLVGLHALDF